MCKSKIEKTAKEAGAKTAEWNKDTKELTITYSSTTTNTAKIQQKLADVGYDNEAFTATKESYDKLHSCCKYDRTAMTVMKDKKSCCAEGCDMKEGKCDMSKCKEKDCCKDEAACKSMGCCSGEHADKGDKGMKDMAMDCCKDGKCTKEGHKGGDCCAKK
jgi:hypothetical protein